MLKENIHIDLVIETLDGPLRAHRAILASRSSVFDGMFGNDFKEKNLGVVKILNMSTDEVLTFLSYIYGTIKHDDFSKHSLTLMAAADIYDIQDLKDCSEEILLADINTTNVLKRLGTAWLYKANKLMAECLKYLFEFGMLYVVRKELKDFFRMADRELLLEFFEEVFTVWKNL
ncbi:BTB/POZ domain-containing protein At1g21780-like [Zingiber officinale]|uniref:BTB/POZ domain-containing protein At1g21780-like n=1 Tax=Zingiber officinale TaxID=94328 RepID=UPI001C4AF47F|nr:BTB/POZ domain-containing protein At1g21780-like [Zingiber officinale]